MTEAFHTHAYIQAYTHTHLFSCPQGERMTKVFSQTISKVLSELKEDLPVYSGAIEKPALELDINSPTFLSFIQYRL